MSRKRKSEPAAPIAVQEDSIPPQQALEALHVSAGWASKTHRPGEPSVPVLKTDVEQEIRSAAWCRLLLGGAAEQSGHALEVMDRHGVLTYYSAPPAPRGLPEVLDLLAHGGNHAARRSVLLAVWRERDAQDKKWGDQPLHLCEDLCRALAVISEEHGEVARHVVEWSRARYRKDSEALLDYMREELVQLAAVSVAAVESIDALRPVGPKVVD